MLGGEILTGVPHARYTLKVRLSWAKGLESTTSQMAAVTPELSAASG